MDNNVIVMNKIKRKVSELTVDDIERYCEEVGLTVYTFIHKLKDLMNARRNIYDTDGEWKDEESDNNIQLKALIVGLELLKLTGSKDMKVSGVIEHRTIPSEDIPRLEAVVKEMAYLRREVSKNKVQQGIEDGVIVRSNTEAEHRDTTSTSDKT